MGAIAHWVLGVAGGVWAFSRAGLPQWVIELLGAGEKKARWGTRTGLLTSGNPSYFMGSIARWVLGVTGGGVGIYLGGSARMAY